MGNSSSGSRRKSIWAWGIVAVLALLFFVLLSVAQGFRWFAPGVSSTSEPTEVPTLTVTATGTPKVAVAAADLTPGWAPTSPAEATMQAVVLHVLANQPTATPTATPDVAATATAQAHWVATVVAEVGADGGGQASAQDGGLALWLSALTAITALVGLVSTLLLNWRKERRDADQARAELAKTQLEVEKLRRELGG